MQFAELFETMRPDQDGCICVAGLGFSLSNTYFNLCYECCVSSVVLVAAALQASQLATRDKRLSAARSVSLAAFILIGSQLAPALSYLPDAVQTGAIVDSTSLLLCVIETAEAPNASTLAAAPNASTLVVSWLLEGACCKHLWVCRRSPLQRNSFRTARAFVLHRQMAVQTAIPSMQ